MDRAIVAADKLPFDGSFVENGHLAQAIVGLVKKSGDILDTLVVAQCTVAFNVTCHAVDEMCQSFPRDSVIGVVVDNCGFLNLAIRGQWEQAFVPENVTRS